MHEFTDEQVSIVGILALIKKGFVGIVADNEVKCPDDDGGDHNLCNRHYHTRQEKYWVIALFDDAGAPDYFDHIVDPAGKVFDYDYLNDYEKAGDFVQMVNRYLPGTWYEEVKAWQRIS